MSLIFMRMNIPEAMRDLAQTLQKLRELEEWNLLAKQEYRRDVPPSFQVSNHVDVDMRVQATAFVSSSLRIQEILNDPDLEIREVTRQRWLRRLHNLEQEFAQLTVAEKLIYP